MSRKSSVPRLKVVFLLHNAYAVGGTVRTTLNLATALVDAGHEAEVVSLRRHRDEPRFAWDPRVRLVPLVDLREGSTDTGHPQFDAPARDFPRADRRYAQYSRLHDLRVRGYLEGSDADVIFGTRPGLNVYLARFGPRRALCVAQEHLRLEAHSKKLRAVLGRHYRSLDAVVTTTAADAAAYRRRMRLPGVPVVAVPNIVPEPHPSVWETQPPAHAMRPSAYAMRSSAYAMQHPVRETDPSARGRDGRDLPVREADPSVRAAEGDGQQPAPGEPVVAAAGRLVPGKRFDLLVEAFTAVAAKHPEWQLRIYGGGPEKQRLRQLIDGLELGSHVRLMGTRSPIEAEFARASLVASSSDAESFGMTLVEAMRCGVPVISTDCPLGPAEIIHDGIDGFLVPRDDAHALTERMLTLIENEPRRRVMAQAARVSARRYDPERVVEQYTHLFTSLRGTRLRRAVRRSRWYAAARRAARPWVRRLKAGRFTVRRFTTRGLTAGRLTASRCGGKLGASRRRSPTW